jgi:hypothetical protein
MWIANALAMDTARSDLRYLDAERLDTSEGRLDDVLVVSPSHATLGKLDGVVVDPCRRQVRYYVLERAGWFSSRHYLLPLGTARLLPDRRAVEVDLETDEIGKLEQVDPSDLPKFSDEDLVAAMFRPRAA